jgi:hypothetical protein
VLRKTVAIAGLIVIVAASLLATENRYPGTQATVSASGPAAMGAYLPFVSKEMPMAPPPTPDPNCSPCFPNVCIPADRTSTAA